MAKTYVAQETPEQKQLENKQIFMNELLDNLQGYENNMLYDDLKDVEGKIDDEIFKLLIDKQTIKREDLLKIFADCNSYIIGLKIEKLVNS